MAKITVRKIKTIALIINRPATEESDFVYIAVANKLIEYPSGAKSKIVYIGQTKKGAFRLATSAATRAYKLLFSHGISSLTYYILVPKGHQGTSSWKLLETALLSEFKSMYGAVPKANIQGKKYNFDVPSVIHARRFFTDKVLFSLVKRYSHIGD